ncbi:Origin recognition complex subunit 3, partial [Spiromyces aspiralis]
MFADQTEDAGAILPTNPDTTIAYRLHQEGGRMINLYDWFMAFTSIIERETVDKPDQKAVQARFIHAVDELQYLG